MEQDGFLLYDRDYHELNAQHQHVFRNVRHQDGSVRDFVVDAEPRQPAYFGFKCPRRGGSCTYLRIRGGPADDGTRPTWQWNGSYDTPTMTPSINCLASGPDPQNPSKIVEYSGCGWHGFLTNGKCEG